MLTESDRDRERHGERQEKRDKRQRQTEAETPTHPFIPGDHLPILEHSPGSSKYIKFANYVFRKKTALWNMNDWQ